MSDYILQRMNNSQKFKVKISFLYNGNYINLNNAIIDTGCNHSHFSANLILDIDYGETEEEHEMFDNLLRNAKSKAIKAGYQYTIGRGVESNGKHTDLPLSTDEILNNKNVKFQEKFTDIQINGHSVGNYHIGVSYDTINVALIGMDFIRDWDMHVGLTEEDKVVLLACHKNQLSESYINALKDTFPIFSLMQ